MSFVAVGMSHKTAPIEVRELVAKQTTPLDQTLCSIVRGSTIGEACIVSTCNRVEYYVAGDADPAALVRDVKGFLSRATGLPPERLDPCLYVHPGTAGLRHLFRVAASLDSMVLGEPQILGQVKEAYNGGVEVGSTGAELQRVFQRAFTVAKRVRTETGISQNAVSMSFAAVKLGREIFGDLKGKNVLLIGAGKMSTLAARHLVTQGIAELRVANRSIERAEELAREMGGKASSLSDLELLLARADIVISSTAAQGFVVTQPMMNAVVRQRRYRPLLLVDLAVPRDVDPAVGQLEGVFVYDVDDLEQVVEDNREARAKEASAAAQIVDDEVDAFLRWSRSQEVVPVLKSLRERSLRLADEEASRALATLKTSDPKAEKAVRAAAQAIVNKMLHPVLTHLREAGAQGDPSHLVRTTIELFSLEIAAAEAPRADASAVETSGGEAPADNVVSIARAAQGNQDR
jgi:glutamyl-tRNA reductase